MAIDAGPLLAVFKKLAGSNPFTEGMLRNFILEQLTGLNLGVPGSSVTLLYAGKYDVYQNAAVIADSAASSTKLFDQNFKRRNNSHTDRFAIQPIRICNPPHHVIP